MSLINQMLQDLDARRAAHGVGSRLPSDVRPLPPVPKSRWPLVLGLAAVVAIALGGVYAFLPWPGGQEANIPPTEAPLAAAALVAEPATVAVPQLPAPVSVPPPVAEAVAEPVALPEVLPAEVVAAQVPVVDQDVSLRMAESITPTVEERRPVAAATIVKAPLPTRPRVAESESVPPKAVAPADPAPPAEVVRPISAGTSTSQPLIQKSEPASTPRQRLEADYRRAVAALNQGRIEQAVDGLRAVLTQDALHVGARQLLVKLLLEANRRDEAAQVLDEGLQSQPAQLGWAMTLARLQVDGGDFAQAWQTLDHSMPAADGNADYRGFAAHVLQRLGRNKEAALHFRAAARLAPGDGRWWLGLGLAYEAEGQSTEAREAFVRARAGANLNAELMALVEQKLR
jgi:MSHA biogenesis protein MshN